MVKRRDFIKGLVAAPVVAKAVAETKHEYEWVEPEDVIDRLREGYTIATKEELSRIGPLANMKGVFGWSNP